MENNKPKLTCKSIDNLGWEIRHVELWYENIRVFDVIFHKGNSRSVGHYNIIRNNQIVGSIGGSVGGSGYATILSRTINELGFDISKEEILQAIKDRYDFNLQQVKDKNQKEIEKLEKELKDHISSSNKLKMHYEKRISDLKKTRFS